MSGDVFQTACAKRTIAERRAEREAYARLREEFLRLLTVDGDTKDRRRKTYNQAIFASATDGGCAVFTGTDLGMVLEKFDQAVKHCQPPA